MSTQSANTLLKLIRSLPGAGRAPYLEACKDIPLLALQANVEEAASHQACKALEAVVRSPQPDDALEGAVLQALWELETHLLRILKLPEWTHSKNTPTEY